MICRREIWRKNNKINRQTLRAQTDKKRKIKNLFNFETLLDPVLIGVLHRVVNWSGKMACIYIGEKSENSEVKKNKKSCATGAIGFY